MFKTERTQATWDAFQAAGKRYEDARTQEELAEAFDAFVVARKAWAASTDEALREDWAARLKVLPSVPRPDPVAAERERIACCLTMRHARAEQLDVVRENRENPGVVVLMAMLRRLPKDVVDGY